MKPDNIYLIRHGHSEGNQDKSIYFTKPDYALELTGLGIQQSRQLGRLSSLDSFRIYCSPYFRARRTAEQFLIGAGKSLETKIYEDPRLREQEWARFTSLEEKERIEAERLKYGSYFYRFPGGESGADVDLRISSFLNTLYRDFAKEDYPRNSVIFSHGAWIKMFLRRFFHLKFEFIQEVKTLPNCGFYRLRLSGEKYLIPTTIGHSPETIDLPFIYEKTV